MAIPLADLIAALPRAQVRGDTELAVEAITCDSRQVRPGSLFVAYRGVTVDGHVYIPQAVSKGALAVVAEKGLRSLAVPLIVVPDGREALAYLSAAWHGFPARQLTVVGVTGTDGKTTTCNLLHSILTAAGRRVGLVTTVNAVIGERVIDTGLHTTTPDASDMQGYLAEMVAAGMELAVLEATSHGLAQHRVAACDFDVAVVTNITHEHLDIHGSLEGYQRAKARLFHHLTAGHRKPGVCKVAVLNADDDSYRYLQPMPADRQLAYSIEAVGGPADVVATGLRRSAADTRFTVQSPEVDFELRTVLVGDFNISNILAATSAALALGVPVEAIQQGVWDVKGIVGRMERIDEGQDFSAIVDFAHTPNALERALEAARTLTGGRVIAVFGSAGLRDVEKRAWMGEIGGRLADVTILTAEDPRTESLDGILAEMASGAERAGAIEGQSFFRVPDRAEAIQSAVDLARPGDVVIACGKGHEQSMCYGTVEMPWSEHEAMRSALRRRLGHSDTGSL
ncbi:MAG TPA: UDP-N-acetylmuramoyl-L-alanyl-D-glutamate--2,6-diaminopimelate ligase [Anaerolineae bacterium]|nr:UDP-N-acetylmuramoyl-L-alanyl-D-glutamate--2,6-diaminopimelate ligase [Anaerolineae bacterium]